MITIAIGNLLFGLVVLGVIAVAATPAWLFIQVMKRRQRRADHARALARLREAA
jgi:type II secretory pathway pseudopilin PulG